MNADAFRQLYNYHFTINRRLWDACITPLTDDQFTKHASYAHGSIRSQLVHLISVDDAWFSGLLAIPEPLDPATFEDRASIRAHWDTVEQHMRDYLVALRDDMLFDTPLDGEDKDLMVWQVLLQVVNHGTDHRAQLLRMLHDEGIETMPQDFIFYVYDNL